MQVKIIIFLFWISNFCFSQVPQLVGFEYEHKTLKDVVLFKGQYFKNSIKRFKMRMKTEIIECCNDREVNPKIIQYDDCIDIRICKFGYSKSLLYGVIEVINDTIYFYSRTPWDSPTHYLDNYCQNTKMTFRIKKFDEKKYICISRVMNMHWDSIIDTFDVDLRNKIEKKLNDKYLTNHEIANLNDSIKYFHKTKDLICNLYLDSCKIIDERINKISNKLENHKSTNAWWRDEDLPVKGVYIEDIKLEIIWKRINTNGKWKVDYLYQK